MNSCSLTLIKLVCTATILTLVTSCGGGSRTTVISSSTDNQILRDFSISGVGLIGAAIVDGAVAVKCKSGNGSAVTKIDGSFSLSVVNGQKPCLLQIKDPISNILIHSLLESESVTNVANISPVTDLVVANVLGQSPSDAFRQFDTTIQTKLTAQNVSIALQVVKAATASLGSDVDMSSVDILKGSIVAKQGNIAGDATDKKIDALMSALASSDKKISELSDQIKTATTSSAATAFKNVLGEAVYSLDKCPAARSGDIWTIDFKGSDPTPWKLNFLTNKIKNLNTNIESSLIATIKNSALVKCGFEANIDIGSGPELIKFRVSDGGVASWTNGISKFGLSVPKQTSRKPTVKDFGGIYSAIHFLNIDSATRVAGELKFTIDELGIKVNECYRAEISPHCNDDESKGITPSKLVCNLESDGLIHCSTPDNKIKSKAVIYVNGGQSIMLWSISKMFFIYEAGSNCSSSSPPACTSYSNSVDDAKGLIVMSKGNIQIDSSLNTLKKSGSYIHYKIDGTLTEYEEANFGEVIKTKDEKEFFETAIDGISGIFKNYINSPIFGLLYSVNEVNERVYMISPNGWMLSTFRNDSDLTEWIVGINEPQ